MSTATMGNTTRVPETLKIEVPHDPAIPLLDVYTKDMESGSRRGICTAVFIVILHSRWEDMETMGEQIKKM